VPPTDHYQDLRSRNGADHGSCGLVIECHHHEVATAGQCEIDQRFNTLVKSADNMMLYKYIVRNVANQYGKTVTFMPKPIFGDNGSGMHTHQSDLEGGKPLFAGDGYAGLEPDGAALHRRIAEARARAFGDHRADDQQLQAPGAGLRSAGEPGVFAPQPLGGVPHSDVFGQPKAKRVEFRPPDPAANPYLAFSAMLMAGLDGVLNKIDPGEPLDKDIYDLSPEEMKSVPSMPGSLEEALTCLEEDHAVPAARATSSPKS
jgi:glutamine synthetase